MRPKLPYFTETRDKCYFPAKVKGISYASLLSIALGFTLSLTAIYSGVGFAKAYPVIATIPVGSDPSDIAFDSANGNLYVVNADISSGLPGTVSVISGQTNAVIGSPISVGMNPVGIAFDSANGNLYVVNAHINSGLPGTVSVISGQTNTVIGNPIPVGVDPLGIGFDPANGNLYIANAADDTVSVISGQTNTVIGNPIPVGSPPVRIVFDSANGNLYVATPNRDSDLPGTVSVISGQTNTVIGNPIPVGRDPGGISFDSANGNLYVANSLNNSISIISGQTNTIIGSPIIVGFGPGGIAFDSANGNLYVTIAADSPFVPGTISVISGQTNAVIGSPITAGSSPGNIVFDSANGNLYVTNGLVGTVTVISTAPPVQAFPHTLYSVSDGNGVYLGQFGPDNLTGSDTTSTSVTIQIIIQYQHGPNGIEVPVTGYLCSLDNTIPSNCGGQVLTYTNLLPGTHSFKAIWITSVGPDPNPPVFTWKIVTAQPPPPPPLTPLQATQQLIKLKNSMHLAAATDQVLDAQLNSAIQSFQNNIKIGGCGHLNGFATAVHTYLQVGRLTQTQASQLLQGVQSVEKIAGC